MFWSERLRRSSSAFTTAPKSRAALLAPGGVARAGAGLSMAGYEAPLGGAGVGYPHAAGGPSAGMSRASGSWSRQASYSACRVRSWSTASAHRFGRGRRSFGRTMVRKPRFWSPQRQSVKRECRTGRARQMARVQAQRRRSDDAGPPSRRPARSRQGRRRAGRRFLRSSSVWRFRTDRTDLCAHEEATRTHEEAPTCCSRSGKVFESPGGPFQRTLRTPSARGRGGF